MSLSPQTATERSAEPTARLPRVPAHRPEEELAAVRRRIAADPTLAGFAADAHLHAEHATGMVFAHGRRLTLVEVHQDVDETVMTALLLHRDGLAGRRAAAVVVARRMTVGAARRAQHAGVRFVSLVDLTV